MTSGVMPARDLEEARDARVVQPLVFALHRLARAITAPPVDGAQDHGLDPVLTRPAGGDVVHVKPRTGVDAVAPGLERRHGHERADRLGERDEVARAGGDEELGGIPARRLLDLAAPELEHVAGGVDRIEEAQHRAARIQDDALGDQLRGPVDRLGLDRLAGRGQDDARAGALRGVHDVDRPRHVRVGDGDGNLLAEHRVLLGGQVVDDVRAGDPALELLRAEDVAVVDVALNHVGIGDAQRVA